MTLNIKDPEAHKLAQKITEQTGETMTRAVTEALRERLSRLNNSRKSKSKAEDRCAATLKGKPVDHAALLYDEHGLPR